MEVVDSCGMMIFLDALPLFGRAIGGLRNLSPTVCLGISSVAAKVSDVGRIQLTNIIPATVRSSFDISVDRVVFVHHIDGLALDGELDMDCTTAVVSWDQVRVGDGVLIIVFCTAVLLFLVGLPVLVLQTVLAHISEPGAITACFGIVGMALQVPEPVSLFNSCHNRPTLRQILRHNGEFNAYFDTAL